MAERGLGQASQALWKMCPPGVPGKSVGTWLAEGDRWVDKVHSALAAPLCCPVSTTLTAKLKCLCAAPNLHLLPPIPPAYPPLINRPLFAVITTAAIWCGGFFVPQKVIPEVAEQRRAGPTDSLRSDVIIIKNEDVQNKRWTISDSKGPDLTVCVCVHVRRGALTCITQVVLPSQGATDCHDPIPGVWRARSCSEWPGYLCIDQRKRISYRERERIVFMFHSFITLLPPGDRKLFLLSWGYESKH